MKMTPYWLDTSMPFSLAMQGGPEGTADVAIVGAGFTGLSAALALAKKGAKVVLLEAGQVCSAASGRNGGMCNNGFAQDYASLSGAIGRERANLLYRAFDAGVDKVESIINEEGIDCHFKRVGKLKLAAKPEHYDKIVNRRRKGTPYRRGKGTPFVCAFERREAELLRRAAHRRVHLNWV